MPLYIFGLSHSVYVINNFRLKPLKLRVINLNYYQSVTDWHNLMNKVSLDYSLEEEASGQEFLTNHLDPNSEPNPKMAATDHTAVELSYCSVKNGVNDMLDYIALGTIHILLNHF